MDRRHQSWNRARRVVWDALRPIKRGATVKDWAEVALVIATLLGLGGGVEALNRVVGRQLPDGFGFTVAAVALAALFYWAAYRAQEKVDKLEDAAVTQPEWRPPPNADALLKLAFDVKQLVIALIASYRLWGSFSGTSLAGSERVAGLWLKVLERKDYLREITKNFERETAAAGRKHYPALSLFRWGMESIVWRAID